MWTAGTPVGRIKVKQKSSPAVHDSLVHSLLPLTLLPFVTRVVVDFPMWMFFSQRKKVVFPHKCQQTNTHSGYLHQYSVAASVLTSHPYCLREALISPE